MTSKENISGIHIFFIECNIELIKRNRSAPTFIIRLGIRTKFGF